MSLRASFVLMLVCSAAPLGGFMRGYLPLRAEELALRFPVKPGVKFDGATLAVGTRRRVGSASLRVMEDGVMRFSGQDKAGLEWTFETASRFDGTMYTGDLDADGQLDLVYASYTWGNGLAPTMHLVVLLFDDKGRPVLWNVDGYFETTGSGIADLLDLNRDGRAELVRQTYDDGYWITSLYEARSGRWHLVGGEHAGRKYPLYTRFTHRANRVAVTPAAGRHPVEDDLSNTPASEGPLFLEKLTWADVRVSARPRFDFSDGRRCVTVSWYATMTTVVDEPGQRTGATLGSPQLARQLLERIVKEKLPVWVGGRRGPRGGPVECNVETVWATVR